MRSWNQGKHSPDYAICFVVSEANDYQFRMYHLKALRKTGANLEFRHDIKTNIIGRQLGEQIAPKRGKRHDNRTDATHEPTALSTVQTGFRSLIRFVAGPNPSAGGRKVEKGCNT